MTGVDHVRTHSDPVADAKLFAGDALRAARAAWSAPADADAAMMAVFVVLAAEALFPDLVREPAGGGGPSD